MTNKKENKESKENKKTKISFNKKYFVVPLIILIVLFIIILGRQSVVEEKDYSKYNGFLFEQDSFGFWTTTLKSANGYRSYTFRNHPYDLEELNINKTMFEYVAITQALDGTIIFSLDPNLTEAGIMGVIGFDMANIFASYFGLKTKASLLTSVEGEEFPVYTCNDSGPELFVIEFRKDKDYLISEEFCAVFGVENFEETIKLSNLFMYNLLGVMN